MTDSEAGPPAGDTTGDPAPAALQPTESAARAGMGLAALTTVIFLLGLIPAIGFVNWFNVIISLAGMVVSLVGICADRGQRRRAGLALAICTLILFLGTLQLIYGKGMV